MLSFVDRDRQWFKSRFGLDATETPRCQAFCAHAILDSSQSLVVEDTTKDARFFDNPLVTGDLGIRFYAGAVVKSPNDELPLGTLCIIDQQPRRLSARKIRLLEKLAGQIEHLLVLRSQQKKNHEVTLALCESEAKVRGILDYGQTFLGLMKPDGTLIDANRTSLNAAGVDAEDILGKAFWEAPWWSHSQDLQDRLQEATRRGILGQAIL